jgi:hypothetical protein
MKLKPLLFLFVCTFVGVLHGQGHYTVVAENGLSLREAPSAEAKKIASLPFRTQVWANSFQSESTLLRQGEETIKGKWIRVQAPEGLAGYVFDAYLLPLTYPERESYCERNNTPCHARLFAKDFDAVIYDYETEGNDFGAKRDTIFTFEDIGVTIEDKLLQITPKQAGDSVAVFFTFMEEIRPDAQSRKEGQSWEAFEATHPGWRGFRPYKRLRGKNNFFRIPTTLPGVMEAWRKGNMGLGDTLVEYSGEGGYMAATMLYEGVPAFYILTDALLKVVIYRKNEKPTVTYISANFTYGC